MNEPPEPTPEEREDLTPPDHWINYITAPICRDPSKLPPMRWTKKNGSYRLEMERRYFKVKGCEITDEDFYQWEEVPFWPGE